MKLIIIFLLIYTTLLFNSSINQYQKTNNTLKKYSKSKYNYKLEQPIHSNKYYNKFKQKSNNKTNNDSMILPSNKIIEEIPTESEHNSNQVISKIDSIDQNSEINSLSNQIIGKLKSNFDDMTHPDNKLISNRENLNLKQLNSLISNNKLSTVHELIKPIKINQKNIQTFPYSELLNVKLKTDEINNEGDSEINTTFMSMTKSNDPYINKLKSKIGQFNDAKIKIGSIQTEKNQISKLDTKESLTSKFDQQPEIETKINNLKKRNKFMLENGDDLIKKSIIQKYIQGVEHEKLQDKEIQSILIMNLYDINITDIKQIQNGQQQNQRINDNLDLIQLNQYFSLNTFAIQLFIFKKQKEELKIKNDFELFMINYEIKVFFKIVLSNIVFDCDQSTYTLEYICKQIDQNNPLNIISEINLKRSKKQIEFKLLDILYFKQQFIIFDSIFNAIREPFMNQSEKLIDFNLNNDIIKMQEIIFPDKFNPIKSEFINGSKHNIIEINSYSYNYILNKQGLNFCQNDEDQQQDINMEEQCKHIIEDQVIYNVSKKQKINHNKLNELSEKDLKQRIINQVANGKKPNIFCKNVGSNSIHLLDKCGFDSDKFQTQIKDWSKMSTSSNVEQFKSVWQDQMGNNVWEIIKDIDPRQLEDFVHKSNINLETNVLNVEKIIKESLAEISMFKNMEEKNSKNLIENLNNEQNKYAIF